MTLRRFDPESRTLRPVETVTPSGWIHASHPTLHEVAALREHGVPASFVAHAMDVDEVARVDREGAATLVVLRVPQHRADVELPYRSESFGIVILEGQLVTISRNGAEIVAGIARLDRLDPARPLRFVLQIAMYAAERFLGYVRAIDDVVSGLESKLRGSLENREVVELLKYQKGLTHFTTALVSNRILLEHLGKDPHLRLDADEREMLEESLVEVDQAISMARISADILSQMMDAFASIISNNLNVVMKVLTAATLVLNGPILVASVYGMNVQLPGAASPLAFAGLVAFSTAVALGTTLYFWRRRWL